MQSGASSCLQSRNFGFCRVLCERCCEGVDRTDGGMRCVGADLTPNDGHPIRAIEPVLDPVEASDQHDFGRYFDQGHVIPTCCVPFLFFQELGIKSHDESTLAEAILRGKGARHAWKREGHSLPAPPHRPPARFQ